MKRLKLRIKVKILKVKMNWFYKRWITLEKKQSRLYEKYNAASTDFFNANQNVNPENTWEMRAEREFHKANY